MIAVHTLAGMGLIVVSAVLYGLLLVRGTPYRAWLKRAAPVVQSLIGYAALTPLAVGFLAGLNLAFGFHPLGIDYHRPSTYANVLFVLLPALIFESLVRYFSDKLSRPAAYSAVSDDWLLWPTPSDENAKA